MDHAHHGVMEKQQKANGRLRIEPWGIVLALTWSVLVLISYFWNAHQTRSLLVDQVRTELRANFFKDLTFRQWATHHGGVYVPITNTQHPDPYVAFLPERDIVTPSGRKLTLINPALMVRQFNELAREKYGAEGHISGIKPLNPINAPDAWERTAYTQLQQGAEEVTGVSDIKGASYLRLIRPMMMGQECLLCHAQQGFKAGDFSGGVSVSVALAPIEQLFNEKNSVLIGAHFILWLFGLTGIILGKTLLARRVAEREQAHAALAENEQRTRAIVASSLDAIITIDAEGHITGWNEQAELTFGWAAHEVIGVPITETIIPERYRHAHQQGVANALGNSCGMMLNRRVEISAVRRDGAEIPVELSIVTTIIGGSPAFCAFLRDISSRKEVQQKMERDFVMQRTVARVLEITMQEASFTERLTQILKETLSVPWLQLQAKGSVFVVGEDGQSLEMVAHHGMSDETMSRCAVVQFGDCLCGKVALRQEIIHKPCIDHDHDHRSPAMTEHGHYCLPIMSGERLLGVFNLYIVPHHPRSEDELQLLTAVSHAIGAMIQHHEAEQRLRYNAYHDMLTGLPNRPLFNDRLMHCMARHSRHADYLFAVLFLDLDRFKVINDSLGHAVGDRLLVEVAKRLRVFSRPEDTVARLGGDEFTLLLDGIRSPDDASRIAARIHDELRVPYQLDGNEVFAPCSIGIAIGEKNYREAAEVMRDADTAMYHAKQQGGARSVVFGKKMHDRAIERLKTEADLRRALEDGELRVHYQPIFSAISGRIEGFEALVRWPADSERMISPAEFIPIAEETGIILELGLWVLREACRQVGIWQRTLPDCAHLHVSVNLSGRQLMQGDLPDSIDNVLEGLDFNPASLRLEITESVLMANAEVSSKLITQLRQRGIHFYIDDFGTGYSSLSYLHRFPFDALKIDRSFVAKLGSGEEHVKLVETIVAIAQNFGMKVIAEGVELPAQRDKLRHLGCEFLQGYLLAHPLPASEVEALLRQQLPLETV
jgi:diguanylate cyclase (GGDEF)-like protein/PAS domain S-box-containing protein